MRIIKRTRGTKEYFYLQHTQRKEGKVTTQERYIGTQIPDNIEEIKAQLLQDIRKSLTEKLEKIKSNFQKEWQTTPPSAKENQLQELTITFTYNTNAIEGSTLTQEETRQILQDQIAPSRPLKDIKETEAHATVFAAMLKMPAQTPISPQLLLDWHQEMFAQTKPDIAGKFRTYPVRVGSYLAPDWQKIENSINQLVTFINEATLNPVELAARAHYIFEKIHPFGDGNGRVGRLLMNQILWKNGYPLLTIEYAKRKRYYQALEQTEEEFTRYFMRRYITTHKKLLL